MQKSDANFFLSRPILSFSVLTLIITILTAGLGYYIYTTNLAQGKQSAVSELAAVARTTKAGLDEPALYKQFVGDAGAKSKYEGFLKKAAASDTFKTSRNQIRGIIKSNAEGGMSADNLYAFVIDKFNPDQLRWALMAHPKSFVGEVYTPPAAALEALRTGEDKASDIYLSTASNKKWISVYCPLTYKGEVFGLVEAAIQVEDLFDRIAERSQSAILLVVFIVLLALVALIVITRLLVSIRRQNENLAQSNQQLTDAKVEIEASEKKYRHLTEDSDDIILVLDAHGQVLSANKAVKTHLGLKPDRLVGRSITDTYDAEQYTQRLDRDILLTKIDEFPSIEDGTDQFGLSFYHSHSQEPKEFAVSMQRIDEGVLMRAVHIKEHALAKQMTATKVVYEVDNFLNQADSVSQKIAADVTSYVDGSLAREIKVSIREMLINAIEHGNLNITFEEKTQAQMMDGYLELIQERRNDARYGHRRTKVEYIVNPRRLAVRITDEGAGFDHKNYLKNRSLDAANDSLLAHGRGIHMTQNIFDRVSYNEAGNQVLLVKVFAGDPAELVVA